MRRRAQCTLPNAGGTADSAGSSALGRWLLSEPELAVKCFELCLLIFLLEFQNAFGSGISPNATVVCAFVSLKLFLASLSLWLQRRLESDYVERSHLEETRREAELSAQMELNNKLEQVNGYLSEQAHAREKLDAIRESTESRLKETYETTRRELQVSLTYI